MLLMRSFVPALTLMAVLCPPSAAGAPAQGALVEEVVVTARKLEESLQETPVAVTAINATQMENWGIDGLADISKITAGLIFDSEFARGANRPVIRGQANILNDSGVSYSSTGFTSPAQSTITT